MSRRRGWDWEALELFREWKARPIPADFPVGSPVLHRPSGQWLLFGEIWQDQVLTVDDHGVAWAYPLEECTPGWLPESDPQKFVAELQQKRANRA